MTWNPFNCTAGPFLSFYLCFAAIVLCLGYYLRSKIGPAAQATHRLSELELAYLGGGARRVGDVMLLGLTSGSGAALDPKSHKISVTDQAPLAALIDRPPLLTFKPAMTRRESGSPSCPSSCFSWFLGSSRRSSVQIGAIRSGFWSSSSS
jgi:hypothetical protein